LAVILALDTATTTGFSWGLAGGSPEWGARKFKAQNNGELFAMFRHFIGELVAKTKPRLILFERVYIPTPGAGGGSRIPMNATTVSRLIGLPNIVEEIGETLRIPYYEATSGAATKFLTGRGTWRAKGDNYAQARAKKKAAVVAACHRYGWNVENDDEADALALWALAENQVAPHLAEQRRREAADRDREQRGEGPLFPITDEQSAPQGQPRGARKPKSTQELSLWPETALI
jgi:hypothetical protein